MTTREQIKILWETATRRQRWAIGLIVATIFGFLTLGWINSGRFYLENRALEKGIKEAKAEAEVSLEKAAAIATEIRRQQTAVKILEEKRDEKRMDLKKADDEASAAAGAVRRARREPRRDSPSADELCRELAGLGYPCGR